MGDYGHPLAEPDPVLVQSGGLGPRQLGHPGIGQLTPTRSGLVRLIHDSHPVAVHRLGAVQEVPHAQRYLHAPTVPRPSPGRHSRHRVTEGYEKAPAPRPSPGRHSRHKYLYRMTGLLLLQFSP